MALIIDLIRVVKAPLGTFGVMLSGNTPMCLTCEDPWNGNQTSISCIPPGSYSVTNYTSSKFPNVWSVNNVPGRSAILIHNGNTILDTHGCILVGASYGTLNGYPSVTDSVNTLSMLKVRLPDTFSLRITDGCPSPQPGNFS